MIARLREVSAAALLGVLVAAPALGQADRSWVEPPASAEGAAEAPADAPENERWMSKPAVRSSSRAASRPPGNWPSIISPFCWRQIS